MTRASFRGAGDSAARNYALFANLIYFGLSCLFVLPAFFLLRPDDSVMLLAAALFQLVALLFSLLNASAGGAAAYNLPVLVGCGALSLTALFAGSVSRLADLFSDPPIAGTKWMLCAAALAAAAGMALSIRRSDAPVSFVLSAGALAAPFLLALREPGAAGAARRAFSLCAPAVLLWLSAVVLCGIVRARGAARPEKPKPMYNTSFGSGLLFAAAVTVFSLLARGAALPALPANAVLWAAAGAALALAAAGAGLFVLQKKYGAGSRGVFDGLGLLYAAPGALLLLLSRLRYQPYALIVFALYLAGAVFLIERTDTAMRRAACAPAQVRRVALCVFLPLLLAGAAACYALFYGRLWLMFAVLAPSLYLIFHEAQTVLNGAPGLTGLSQWNPVLLIMVAAFGVAGLDYFRFSAGMLVLWGVLCLFALAALLLLRRRAPAGVVHLPLAAARAGLCLALAGLGAALMLSSGVRMKAAPADGRVEVSLTCAHAGIETVSYAWHSSLLYSYSEKKAGEAGGETEGELYLNGSREADFSLETAGEWLILTVTDETGVTVRRSFCCPVWFE